MFSPDPVRGLSLGGRFLTCDCRMRWVSEWIRRHDLQVTSREREPKFCGHPQRLRDRSFYQLEPEGKIHNHFWDGISQKKDDLGLVGHLLGYCIVSKTCLTGKCVSFARS